MSSTATNSHFKLGNRALILLDQPWLTSSHLKQIQSHLTVSGSLHDAFTTNRLITAFTSGGYSVRNISHAHKLFLLQSQQHRTTSYMWNSMIRACTESSQPTNSISLYKYMLGEGFSPNNYTFSFLIRACIDIHEISVGLVLHAQVIRLGWESYDFVQNGLIHLYAIWGLVGDARKLFDASWSRDVVTWTALINGYVRSNQIQSARELFDEMPCRNSVTWAAMITGCVQSQQFEEALELFKEMQIGGVRPTHAAVVGALTACAFLGALEQGRWIHAYVRRNGLEVDTKLGTALVDMYAKCGCIESAQQVFDLEIPTRDVFAFTSLISGLSNNGQSSRAIQFFQRMQDEQVDPNRVTLLCVLSACGRIGSIEQGLDIFNSMRSKYKIEPGMEHYACIVDLLGRAGLLREAEKMVTEMPLDPDSDVLCTFLHACRIHGDVERGQQTVKRLVDRKINRGGFQALLSNIYACSEQWDGVQRVRNEMEEMEMRKVPGSSVIQADGIVREFGAGKIGYAR